EIVMVLPAPAVAGAERPVSTRSAPIWMNQKRGLLNSLISEKAPGPSAFANSVYAPGARGSGRVIDVVAVFNAPTASSGTVLVPTTGSPVSSTELLERENE